jgi:3-methyladenine DNA glycosylase/8-oxoguanine DNA glycosylase
VSREVECEVGVPFDARALLAYWRVRCVPGMESIEDGVYRRSLRWGEEIGELSVDVAAGAATGRVIARPSANLELEASEVESLVSTLVDGAAPTGAVAKALCNDDVLGPLVADRPGIRVPGTVDPFELTVRAIVGQQVSVAAASTFTARIADAWGDRASRMRLPLVFPAPAQLADAQLEERCGINRQRADAIRTVAGRMLAGELDLRPGHADEAELEAVPGVGPWTAAYVALRGLGEPDAIPVADLGLRSALGLDTPAEVAARAERWRPFRGYAATHLWTTFLDLDT